MLQVVKDFIEKFNFNVGFNSRERYDFAIQLIEEEVGELREAFNNSDPEEIVDALGDISWLCDKLMIQSGVDPEKVRAEIGRANLSKERGVKPGREQSGGFDVMKPEGWKAPDHTGNHGNIKEIINE